MSEVRTFFRHCPACGRRFEIRVVRKEPRNRDSYESEIPRTGTDMVEERTLTPLILSRETNEPVIIEEKELSYTYMCKHCGHQWTEVREKIEAEPPPKGYTGD